MVNRNKNSHEFQSIDGNIRIGNKVWTTIDKLKIIRKSDLFDKIKWKFFQAVTVSELLHNCTTCTLTKYLKEKWDGNYIRILQAILNKSWKQHPTKQRTLLSQTIQEKGARFVEQCWSKDRLISDVLRWTPTSRHTSAGWPAKFISSKRTLDTVKRTNQMRWPIGIDNKRESKECMLSVGTPLMMMMMILQKGCPENIQPFWELVSQPWLTWQPFTYCEHELFREII